MTDRQLLLSAISSWSLVAAMFIWMLSGWYPQ